jgi:hypothetical protein
VDEIILSSDSLLRPHQELAVGPLHILPAEVLEELHDEVHQELLSVMVGPIGIFLINAQHKIVQLMTIR